MFRALSISVLFSLGALPALPAAAQVCEGRCAAINALVCAASKTGKDLHCDCCCRFGEAPLNGRCAQDQTKSLLAGSAEWLANLPKCEALGRELILQLRTRHSQAATGSGASELRHHVGLACAKMATSARAQSLGGCAATCGRQMCEALLALPDRDFVTTSGHIINGSWRPCAN